MDQTLKTALIARLTALVTVGDGDDFHRRIDAGVLTQGVVVQHVDDVGGTVNDDILGNCVEFIHGQGGGVRVAPIDDQLHGHLAAGVDVLIKASRDDEPRHRAADVDLAIDLDRVAYMSAYIQNAFAGEGATVIDEATSIADAEAEAAEGEGAAGVAEAVVEEVEGNPGYYTSKFFLRPHYQLEGLSVSLRLVSKLPSQK